VGVSVEVDGRELRGRVEDDGEGFEPGEVPGGKAPTGRTAVRPLE
jgi:signal transduction histidine kinase